MAAAQRGAMLGNARRGLVPADVRRGAMPITTSAAATRDRPNRNTKDALASEPRIAAAKPRHQSPDAIGTPSSSCVPLKKARLANTNDVVPTPAFLARSPAAMSAHRRRRSADAPPMPIVRANQAVVATKMAPRYRWRTTNAQPTSPRPSETASASRWTQIANGTTAAASPSGTWARSNKTARSDMPRPVLARSGTSLVSRDPVRRSVRPSSGGQGMVDLTP